MLRNFLKRGSFRTEDGRGGLRRGATRRSEERVATSLGAQIVCGGQVIECTIRDISPRGARLRVPNPQAVPPAFELLFKESGRTRPARLRWKSRAEIGVIFSRERRVFGRRTGPAAGS